MDQSKLGPAPGSKHERKRVGRGLGSGHGTYCGRGLKGQKARSGGQLNPRFEGGQTPLVKRLPQKRGFTNIFRSEYAVINLSRLGRFNEGIEVNPEVMTRAGLVKRLGPPIKVLGHGELNRPLVVKAHKFSQTARVKIEAAGGRAEVI